MIKLTFKKHKPLTGLAAVAYSRQSVDIKHKKLVIGQIKAPNWATEDGKWGIGLMVKDGVSWKWVFFKKRCDTEQEAREWIQERIEIILERNNLQLHYSEPFNN